ncbi:N-acetyltransferase family protein [Rhodococcus sp. ACT016]|uniref:GNAT family N-acetyltransferase n=1 Tax=Rhodococcus sp. ACT016 TaxID=3134808 RepID=UPI003D288BCF
MRASDRCRRPLTAEFALAVSGHEQRHGIGTMLVRRLGVAAFERGVDHLTAEILAENTLMLSVITEQGWSHTSTSISALRDCYPPSVLDEARCDSTALTGIQGQDLCPYSPCSARETVVCVVPRSGSPR